MRSCCLVEAHRLTRNLVSSIISVVKVIQAKNQQQIRSRKSLLLLFSSEDGSNEFDRNVGELLPDYTA
jgi:hypothetical protein